MKPLLVEILESILRTDGKLAYVITCDEEELVSLTRDISLACNQKEGHEYEAVNSVDEARIGIESLGETKNMPDVEYDYVEGDQQSIGFIYWRS